MNAIRIILMVPILIFASGAGRAAAEGTGLAGANLMMTAAASLLALVLAPMGAAVALKGRLE
jgi:heme exporter protein B